MKNEQQNTSNKPQTSKENKGSGPAPNIPDGGGSVQKQPKEHTGKNTEMGGSTGGESKNTAKSSK